MSKEKLNSYDLAREIDIPAATIRRIKNNEQTNPTLSTLLPIAKYFSVSLGQLVGEEPLASTTGCSTTKTIQFLPLVSLHECFLFYSHQYKVNHFVPTDQNVSEKAFAIMSEDADLEYFPRNSMLIVDPALNPVSSNYVIVSSIENGVSAIRKYLVEIDQVYLQPLMSGMETTKMSKEYIILGVVVECNKRHYLRP